MNLATVRKILLVIALTVIPTIAIWTPFFLRVPEFWGIPLPRNGMETIVANYDGPLYIVVSKTLYNTAQIKNNFAFGLPVEYYAAHFPLFPLLIRAIAGVTKSFPYSMLFATILSSGIAIWFFHKFISQFVKKEGDAIWLTVVFALFPARWLMVRSVGSPEPLFIGGIIASVYYFQNKKYWLAGIWGALVQLTKSPGALLFVAYAAALILPKLKELSTTKLSKWAAGINWKVYPIILIPLALIVVFGVYSQTFKDFYAYFHSGDNIHLFFPPFQIFNYSAPWVGTFWLEEIIFIYLLGALGLLYLIKQKRTVLAYFVAVFFVSTLFVSHRDLMRYSLPLVPFLIVAFSDALTKKEFKIAFLVILIPIYLNSLVFISQNAMPVSNWAPLL